MDKGAIDGELNNLKDKRAKKETSKNIQTQFFKYKHVFYISRD